MALYRSLIWLILPTVGQPSNRAVVTVKDNSAKKVFVHTVSINKDKIVEVELLQCNSNSVLKGFVSDKEISRASDNANLKAGNHIAQ